MAILKLASFGAFRVPRPSSFRSTGHFGLRGGRASANARGLIRLTKAAVALLKSTTLGLETMILVYDKLIAAFTKKIPDPQIFSRRVPFFGSGNARACGSVRIAKKSA